MKALFCLPHESSIIHFDGTLSSKDSYLLFTKFVDQRKFWLGCLVLAPRIICYLASIYPNQALKQDFLEVFLQRKKN